MLKLVFSLLLIIKTVHSFTPGTVTSEVNSSISPLETVEPTETIVPTEIVPPAESGGPVAIVKPVQTAGPVQTSESVQTAGPVQTSKSVQTAGPVQTSGPVQTAGPVQTSGPVQTTEPVHTSESVKTVESVEKASISQQTSPEVEDKKSSTSSSESEVISTTSKPSSIYLHKVTSAPVVVSVSVKENSTYRSASISSTVYVNETSTFLPTQMFGAFVDNKLHPTLEYFSSTIQETFDENSGNYMDSEISDFCKVHMKCGSCISASPDCYWCSQQEFDDVNQARCDVRRRLVENRCLSSNIVRPKGYFKIKEDEDLRMYSDKLQAVQLKPQKLFMKLVLGENQTFPFELRMSTDYPLDVYFVMDYSVTMKDHRKNLASVTQELAKSLGKISKNFLVGFGTFVDRAEVPFTHDRLLDRATLFTNRVSLTTNITLLQSEMNSEETSRSEDEPEAGLDAVLQAILCRDIIGWRKYSRKLLLLFSDAFVHFAGDGKAAGLVIPNDEKCHLNKDGSYVKNNMDFVSISQLNRHIMREKVNVIFAVTEEIAPKYRVLEKMLDGSEVGIFNSDDNIIKLIQNVYDKVTSEIEFKIFAPEYIEVNFSSSCGGNVVKQTKSCTGLERGKSVKFELSVRLLRCPVEEEHLHKKQIMIFAVGIPDNIIIDYELACQCDCELPIKKEVNSLKCSGGRGNFSCGLCECTEKSYGKKCECDRSSASENIYEKCIKDNTTKTCSGRGSCVCGVCECHPREMNKTWSGRFCEYDDFSCFRTEGLLCGGPSRGQCKRGICNCNANYTGDACECPVSKELCIASNGIECNGKGICKCGRCDCQHDNRFVGQTCEECPSCKGRCLDMKDCALCVGFKIGNYSEDKCKAICTEAEIADEVKPGIPGEEFCRYPANINCEIYFSYYFKGPYQVLKIQKNKVCLPEVDHLFIVLAVLGGILFVAVVTIFVWRCLYPTALYNIAYKHIRITNAILSMHQKPENTKRISVYVNPRYAPRMDDCVAIVPFSEFSDSG